MSNAKDNTTETTKAAKASSDLSPEDLNWGKKSLDEVRGNIMIVEQACKEALGILKEYNSLKTTKKDQTEVINLGQRVDILDRLHKAIEKLESLEVDDRNLGIVQLMHAIATDEYLSPEITIQ